MNHLINITKKEVREMLTPGTIASMVLVVVMFCAIGSAISGETESSSSAPDIGVVYESSESDYSIDDFNSWVQSLRDGSPAFSGPKDVMSLITLSYMALYDTDSERAVASIHYLDAASGDASAITQAVSDGGLKFAISVDSALTSNVEYIISNYASESAESKRTSVGVYFSYRDEGLYGSASSSTGTALVSQMNTILSEVILLNIGAKDMDGIVQPLSWGGSSNHTEINGTVYDDVTPYDISSAMMSQTFMVPIVVMIVIVMVGSIVISSMGSEKENKTLETLLTMPIKRTTIVSGKLLAAAIMGLIYGLVYMIGMLFYTDGIMYGTSSVDLSDYGLAMGASDWAILMAVLFLSIFSALAICMILGAFTKNYKMAQTMTMPISVLALVPMFVFMFLSWDSLPAVAQVLVFAIPFSHPMMVMNNLVFGNISLVAGGIVYLIVLDAFLVWLTVKIYNSDVLITGFDRSKIKRMFGKPSGDNEDGDERGERGS
ncbi:MAG: ABC transporter permease [Candidatus Methanomethylophilus sp.]|jgi:ABC-2 type transport system permease protein|nr:ABC transporter permease [Methanomethylophilus sp.]MCI2075252.1 ABC transporter permease [Methanomethylophilus sp.]MCI2092594.1 ABC transporter permease [Methanomethylophilus sp.]